MIEGSPTELRSVELPSGVQGTFEVFVNGVQRQPGVDFDQVGCSLVFREALASEGRLGPWRWLSILFGVAGSYRKNDTVDVVYSAGGRRVVATLEPQPYVPGARP